MKVVMKLASVGINFFLISLPCVAGISTALKMCYRGYGYPLTLHLEEGGVVTVCKINTQEPEEPIDFDFCSSNVTNKVDNMHKTHPHYSCLSY